MKKAKEHKGAESSRGPPERVRGKQNKIWITACVHLLFCSTFFTSSGGVGNIVTDDDKIISLLKQNIPKDYKIAVHHIPKEMGGLCWVNLNVFYLEESLNSLAQKFGNNSTNKDNITIFIEKLRDVRIKINNLELLMQEFECHYREEKWPTEDYFEYVHDLLNSQPSRSEEDCNSPSCPTSATPSVTAVSPSKTPAMTACNISPPSCNAQQAPQSLPEVIGKSLLPLLLLPMFGVVFLLYWKIKRGRTEDPREGNVDNREPFTGTEGLPPLTEVERPEEKSQLNSIEIV